MSPAGLAAGSSSTCAKRVRCITPETAVARHLVDRHRRAGQRWAGAVGESQGGAGRRPAGDMEPTAPAQRCPAPTSMHPAMKQHRAAPRRVSQTAAPGRKKTWPNECPCSKSLRRRVLPPLRGQHHAGRSSVQLRLQRPAFGKTAWLALDVHFRSDRFGPLHRSSPVGDRRCWAVRVHGVQAQHLRTLLATTRTRPAADP